MSDLTTVARRIAKVHNDAIRCNLQGNGKLVFGLDGTGGHWYSNTAYGFSCEEYIIFPMRQRMVTGRNVQDFLDDRNSNCDFRVNID